MKLYAVITESRNFDWWAFGETEKEARLVFKEMWLNWCAHSGADPEYWGIDFDDISIQEIETGVGYMDREVFK